MFKGNNTFRMNMATVAEAITEYLVARVVPAHCNFEVTNINMKASDRALEVTIAESESPTVEVALQTTKSDTLP